MTPEEIQAEIDAGDCPTIEISEIVPNQDNPRLNNIAAEALARVIAEVGFGAPIVVQKQSNFLIAGHARLKAARILGLKRLPVNVLDIDDRRAMAMSLADNRMSEIAEWIPQMLAQDLGQFSLEEAELLGFDDKYLERLASLTDFGPLDSSPNEPSDDSERCEACGQTLRKRKN